MTIITLVFKINTFFHVQKHFVDTVSVIKCLHRLFIFGNDSKCYTYMVFYDIGIIASVQSTAIHSIHISLN